MKTFAMLILAALMSCASVSAACQSCPQELRVICMDDVTDRILTGMLLGYYPDMAIEVGANTPFPLYAVLESDQVQLFTDKMDGGEFLATETFYVRCKQGKPLFSSDLIEWESFKNFFTGELNVKWNTSEGKSSLILRAELHRRSKT